jgi:hypothetical protein
MSVPTPQHTTVEWLVVVADFSAAISGFVSSLITTPILASLPDVILHVSLARRPSPHSGSPGPANNISRIGLPEYDWGVSETPAHDPCNGRSSNGSSSGGGGSSSCCCCSGNNKSTAAATTTTMTHRHHTHDMLLSCPCSCPHPLNCTPIQARPLPPAPPACNYYTPAHPHKPATFLPPYLPT